MFCLLYSNAKPLSSSAHNVLLKIIIYCIKICVHHDIKYNNPNDPVTGTG